MPSDSEDRMSQPPRHSRLASTVYLAYLDGGAVAHTWSSTDGGASWKPAGPGGFPLALGAGVIYAGAFASSDHGGSWQAVSTPPEPPTALAGAPGSATTVFAATPGQGVWKRGDGAASWQPASTGIFAQSTPMPRPRAHRVRGGTFQGHARPSSSAPRAPPLTAP